MSEEENKKTSMRPHHAGFVSIVGKPNVGKSTLMNALIDEKLSIITSKAQTTRHRIMGIINGDDYQIVYSDTPGVLNPKYVLHQKMMDMVIYSLKDADIILFIVDLFDDFKEQELLIDRLNKMNIPLLFILNKIDLKASEITEELLKKWKNIIPNAVDYIPISAKEKVGVQSVIDKVKNHLPIHPPYYPKDQLTDRPERFFVSEKVREKILQNYNKEIPYACQVEVESFKEEEEIIRIGVIIYVERKTQKPIVIGKNGEKLKIVGSEARIDLEKFFCKKIFLQSYVKVAEDWRKKSLQLKQFGY